jgi:hypothetical protein
MSTLSFTTVSAMLVTLPGISSSTNATSAQLAIFAERAESVMNAKLAKSFTLPFAGRVPVLETIATKQALCEFLTSRVFTQERQNNSEWPDRLCKESMELLDKIVLGEVPLLYSSGGLIAGSTAQSQIWSNTMGYRPTMTEDDERNQVVDRWKIKDIQADRAGAVGPQ